MGYTVTQNGSDFDRGVAAGQIEQRLKEHDQHLMRINGSMGDVATQLSGVKMQLQRMADSMDADRRTVLTTAEALEKERASTATALATEKTTQKETADRKWSPVQRLIAVIIALASVAGAITAVVTLTAHH
jgi:hypothetical protein